MRAPTGATFGDAVIAAVGTGHMSDLGTVVSGAATVDGEFLPDPAKRQLYDDLYQIYRSSYEHVRYDLDELARLSIPEATA